MEFPVGLKYSKEHEWARIEGNRVVIGITDYAQDSLGEIVYVDLPDVGNALEGMETFGTVESVKSVNDLYSPVSGEVVERNDSLEDHPEMINQDPYGDGWMIVVEMSDPAELHDLMSAKEYEQFVQEESE